MGCCADDSLEETKEGVVIKRKCRDVLCLLIFIAFWAGMLVICVLSYQQGDLSKLIYGTDSHGFICGKSYSFMGTTLDLSSKKSLYFLDPLQLLSPTTLPYAKSICVDSCPSADICSLTSLPCTNDNAFMCPYYAFAEQDLTGRLPGIDLSSTGYYGNLTSLTSVNSSVAVQIIDTLLGLEITWINDWLASMDISSSGGLSGAYFQLTSQLPGAGPCYPVWVPTTDIMNRCVPVWPDNITESLVQVAGNLTSMISAQAADTFKDVWNSWDQQISRYIGDTSRGILIIVVSGLLCSLASCLLWMIILRYFAGLMAWLIILLVNVALLGITLYCFSMAGLLGNSTFSQSLNSTFQSYGNPSTLDQSTWKAIAITAAVIAGLVFLLTLLMIRRIKIAIACIKVASQAVGAMPLILLYPIIPFTLEVGLVIYWIAVTALIYTSGVLTATCRNPASASLFSLPSLDGFSMESLIDGTNSSSQTTNCYSNYTGEALQVLCGDDPNCYLSYRWNDSMRYAFIYHFFGLLWTNQFIVGLSCVTIAGAVGSFYWAGGNTEKMPVFPVGAAMWNTFFYHVGSIVFGSLIIAILQFVRFLLEYLDHKTQSLQEGSKVLGWLMCCVKCCAWCLEKTVMFINRNAYIMIGVKGLNYCAAACRALQLIVSNALRLLAVNIIGDMLLFLGKLLVAASCGLAAFGMSELDYYSNANKYPDTYLSSPVFPIAFSILIGFVVAQIFFAVYEMAIDTILLAFCEDCETNGGNPKWAPPLLMEAMGLDANDMKPAPPLAVKSNAIAPEA